MPTQVRILSQNLVNKIAAGEVIVRPASVVKELVENAYDAGARHIRVEISPDARSVSVLDDGCGMDEANAKIAILRHSTSKIREFEDLEHLATRGFRGEALASIISVSRFEMLTRTPDALSGVRLAAAGGKVERVEPVGTAPGTAIHVRDLFFNTPARLKFLKTPAAEFNAAVEILTRQALTRPAVGLTCLRGSLVRFDLPPAQSLLPRIEELLGATVQDRLLPVDFERDGFSVRGFLARPEAARKDRRWQFLMVNGRPISARQLSHPLQEAYRGLLMQQRFPVVVLDIQIPPGEVDVNVHPTKEEVRFEDERKVAGLLYRAVNRALQGANLMPTLDLPTAPAPQAEPDGPVATRTERDDDLPFSPAPRRFPPPPARALSSDPSLPFLFSPAGTLPYAPGRELRDFLPSAGPTPDLFPPAAGPAPFSPPFSAPFSAPALPGADPAALEAALTADNLPPPRPLGQIARTYIVAEWGDDLLLIDQHAAHERLLYQRFAAAESAPPASQGLLIPQEFRVAPSDVDAVEALLPALREMGIGIEPDGAGAFRVDALPADFDQIDVPRLAQDLLDDLRGNAVRPVGVHDLRDRVLVRMACHAAIKANQSLTAAEMNALIADLLRARLPFTCPHGRPTVLLLSKDHLDLCFGRKGPR